MVETVAVEPGNVCKECRIAAVYIKKWQLCKRCYLVWYSKQKKTAHQKWRELVQITPKPTEWSEVYFTKRYFKKRKWLYESVRFRFGKTSYTPDFYDPQRNVFIEVVGTRSAYSSNKHKYRAFKKQYPAVVLEFRHPDGTLYDCEFQPLEYEEDGTVKLQTQAG